jgi:hypothetical protein
MSTGAGLEPDLERGQAGHHAQPAITVSGLGRTFAGRQARQVACTPRRGRPWATAGHVRTLLAW